MKLRISLLIAASAWIGVLSAQPGSAPPEVPKGESSISGLVVNAVTGEPLKKATVTLTLAGSQQYSPRNMDVDAGGRFVFEELPAGRYALTVTRDGFARQRYGAKRPGSQIGGAINLEAKQELKDLRIRLTAHGVISGRIVDEDGEPRPQFNIEAMQSRWLGSKRQVIPVGYGQTNDLGEYRIFGLPPGNYIICATGPLKFDQFVPESNARSKPEEDYASICYPGAMDLSTAAPIQVRSGDESRSIDIKMVKARVFRVRGTVSSGITGRPVRANLRMSRSVGNGTYNAGVMDSKGSFEFRGVTAGQHMLTADASTPEGELSCRVTVVVGDQSLTNLAVSVRPLVSIRGTVVTEGAENGKEEVESDPTPLGVMLQSVEPGNSSVEGGGEVSEGRIVMKELHPGRYRVEVYGGGYLKSVRLGDEDLVENDLEIPEGGVSGELAIVVSRKGAEVNGTVQDEKGTPKPGATALLLPEEKYRAQFSSYGVGPADQHGAFQIKNVRPGKYKLIVLEDAEYGEWMDPEFIKPYEKNAVTLVLEEGQKESRDLTIRAGKPAGNSL